jgi:hypothetical protein
MKIIILHDKAGEIESIAVPGKGLEGEGTLLPEKGKHVIELDSAEIENIEQSTPKSRKIDMPKLAENLSQNFRIKEGKLVRKQSK